MNEIKGQVIYMGPHVRTLGLGYAKIFRNGIHKQLYPAIEKCPSLGELFVPVEQCAIVRKELNFDLAHRMRGKSGKFVTFYREVQKWLASSTTEKEKPSITLEKSHA